MGELLARKLGWKFVDADDFHPPQNVVKMSRGVPLTDADRAPWLDALHDAIESWQRQNENVVLACSALKHSYRERLHASGVRFVYLKGDAAVIRQRLHARRGHFATDAILKSQFEDLEEPSEAMVANIAQSPEAISAEIIDTLKLSDLAYPDATQK